MGLNFLHINVYKFYYFFCYLMCCLKDIYFRRFGEDVVFRRNIWSVLCKDFFQEYIPESSVVLDVGAGYCEFINAIKAKEKIALDLNPDVKKFADEDVKVILSNSVNMRGIKDESVDVVFVSNFLERLSKEDIVKTIREIYRVLRESGRLLILQPNIRYCYKDYWMFFDHLTPLDDRSISEVLELNGFRVVVCKSKFLPYTTKCKLPKFMFLIKFYLKFSFLHCLFGKQAFICAEKI